MLLQTDQSLQSLNTFGVPARADLVVATDEATTAAWLRRNDRPLRVLGGGSNVLLRSDPAEIVLLNRIPGRQFEPHGADVLVTFGGGENWHAGVRYTLDQGLGGLENLSLIPGTMGASPIQNIGAYGVELKDVFHSLRALDLRTGAARTFSAEALEFGYRDSIFKRALKGKMLIVGVTFRLHRDPYRTNVTYGAIREVLHERGIDRPTVRDVSDAVIDIRQRKLPDPAQIGNTGSFFKNPVLGAAQFAELERRHPDPVHYPLADGTVKVPAGWLIDRAGWRGKTLGNVGTYEHQALVLVNRGGATGAEVWDFAQRVQADVMQKFGVRLEPEVNLW